MERSIEGPNETLALGHTTIRTHDTIQVFALTRTESKTLFSYSSEGYPALRLQSFE